VFAPLRKRFKYFAAKIELKKQTTYPPKGGFLLFDEKKVYFLLVFNKEVLVTLAEAINSIILFLSDYKSL
jgi:hypothetical protein